MGNSKEYAKKYNREYYLKNKEKILEKNTSWSKENKDKIDKEYHKEYNKEYYQKNKEKIRKQQETYRNRHKQYYCETFNERCNEFQCSIKLHKGIDGPYPECEFCHKIKQ